jgi:hypothetical protein
MVSVVDPYAAGFNDVHGVPFIPFLEDGLAAAAFDLGKLIGNVGKVRFTDFGKNLHLLEEFDKFFP